MVDETNLLVLITTAASTAAEIAKDTRLPAKDREKARLISEAMKTWRGPSFAFRDWKPAPTTPDKEATA
ncbi:hypothetical protein [Cupriavidus sp. H18C2]|uniref:hypothetical protein n=1 Tax=Cupriavidus sp. H18C2 TaxID=3241602 RepID=UPI003BF79ED0